MDSLINSLFLNTKQKVLWVLYILSLIVDWSYVNDHNANSTCNTRGHDCYSLLTNSILITVISLVIALILRGNPTKKNVNPELKNLSQFLNIKGRVGRSKFFGYGVPLNIGISLTAAVINSGSDIVSGVSSLWIFLPLLALFVYASIKLVVMRLHDMGESGWYTILSLIPLINIGFGLWVLFSKGQAGSNKYGEQPT